MSAHALLNLLDELGKSHFFAIIHNDLVNCVFAVKMSKLCHKYATLLWSSFHKVTCSRESANHQWFIDFNA